MADSYRSVSEIASARRPNRVRRRGRLPGGELFEEELERSERDRRKPIVEEFERRGAASFTRAELVIQFIEAYLKVPEGRLVGEPIVLRDWQKDIIRHIYDGDPLPRTVIISFARKNGKTALIAMLLIAHIVGPMAVLNSQIYSAAMSRDQAAIVFKLASKMVRMAPELARRCRITESGKLIQCETTGVLYRALAAEATTSYGFSPILVIYDELGQVKAERSELYEALESAMGAHENPLSIVISTQAATDQALLSTLIDDAQRSDDPYTRVFLYTVPMEADPFDESQWPLANPAIGDFRSLEDVRRQAERAARMPIQESSFRNLILNQRVAAENLLLSPSLWRAAGGAVAPEVLEGISVFGGLDLSSRQDLTAFVVIGRDEQGKWHVFPRFWTPAGTLEDRARRDKAPYDYWKSKGWISTTPGKSVDYKFVAEQIRDEFGHLDFEEIAFDRWKIKEFRLACEMIDWYPPLKEFGQGYKDMSPAIDSLEHLFMENSILHGDHPVLTYCAANTIVDMDAAENRKVNKARASGRIDGIVALIMAVGAAHRSSESADHLSLIG